MKILRGLKLIVLASTALVVLAISSPLLFWLGRTQVPRDILDPEIDPDDPGRDVDDEALS